LDASKLRESACRINQKRAVQNRSFARRFFPSVLETGGGRSFPRMGHRVRPLVLGGCQALDGLNKECRKAGKKSAPSSVPAFLPSLFQISHFEQDFVLRIQGIELALSEGLGDVEH
jgi:hypothetical protein